MGRAARIIDPTVGRLLTADEMEVAKRLGVRSAENIRVLIVPAVPFPDDPVLREIAAKTGLSGEDSGGLTLGYGIFIRADQTHRNDIWPHEFRHVAQYECFGSIRAFMFFYLKGLLHFGYRWSPLEMDATYAELLARKPIRTS